MSKIMVKLSFHRPVTPQAFDVVAAPDVPDVELTTQRYSSKD